MLFRSWGGVKCYPCIHVRLVQSTTETQPCVQFPQCICPITHNAPFCDRNAYMSAHFCYKIVYCVQGIVGFVRWVLIQISMSRVQYMSHGQACGILVIKPIHLSHWGRDKVADIFQTTFSNGFSWMKMFEFRLKFHWSLFPRVQLTIFQQWFR